MYFINKCSIVGIKPGKTQEPELGYSIADLLEKFKVGKKPTPKGTCDMERNWHDYQLSKLWKETLTPASLLEVVRKNGEAPVSRPNVLANP